MSQTGPMLSVRPFAGIRYDPAAAGDLSLLLCPPYDIIGPEQQRELYRKSRYNMIRLEHPLPAEDDADELERYRTAADTYRHWLAERVLVRDSEPALYVHDHAFVFRGKRHVRRGLVASVLLRPWYDGVYPHELTGTKAKQDRLELMRACRTSFSYPLGLYEDAGETIASLVSDAIEKLSPIEVQEDIDRHSLWAIRDEDALERISQAFTTESIYVADGHHRYETGLVYQAERRAADGSRFGQTRAYDYIPMTLTAFHDPGLFISPVYRVLRGFQLPELWQIEERLKEYFTIDFVPVETALARSAPVGEMALMAVVGLRPGLVAELRSRPGVELGTFVPGEHSSEYRTFNVSILNHVVMTRALGINPDGEGVSYSPDLDAVVRSVLSGDAQLAFLLAPAHPRLVKKISDQMERMPRKSTYFYPKAPTGLAAYDLD
ncbi:MAG: DUF1015 domain-containing protein [Dehalococcoidia bacterium]|nr:DUF1015 domain-containing protein [Dehalococcoidia bacterium]